MEKASQFSALLVAFLLVGSSLQGCKSRNGATSLKSEETAEILAPLPSPTIYSFTDVADILKKDCATGCHEHSAFDRVNMVLRRRGVSSSYILRNQMPQGYFEANQISYANTLNGKKILEWFDHGWELISFKDEDPKNLDRSKSYYICEPEYGENGIDNFQRWGLKIRVDKNGEISDVGVIAKSIPPDELASNSAMDTSKSLAAGRLTCVVTEGGDDTGTPGNWRLIETCAGTKDDIKYEAKIFIYKKNEKGDFSGMYTDITSSSQAEKIRRTSCVRLSNFP